MRHHEAPHVLVDEEFLLDNYVNLTHTKYCEDFCGNGLSQAFSRKVKPLDEMHVGSDLVQTLTSPVTEVWVIVFKLRLKTRACAVNRLRVFGGWCGVFMRILS